MGPRTPGAIACLIAFLTLLGTLAIGQPAGVLQALGLAGYPADTRPPGFSAATVDGRPLSLESLRSRVVLLNFWATWCLECRVEMPALEQLHRDYASRGLTALAVNFREEPRTIRQYARELGLTMSLLRTPPAPSADCMGSSGSPPAS
jgi:thiol-disulfide isomerase/thioredoxin